MVSPCLDCDFRNANCHAVCEMYAKFRDDCDVRRSERIRQSSTRDYIVGSILKTKKRVNRRGK